MIEEITDEIIALSVAGAGYLDELAAANLPADVDAILADTNELQTAWHDSRFKGAQ